MPGSPVAPTAIALSLVLVAGCKRDESPPLARRATATAAPRASASSREQAPTQVTLSGATRPADATTPVGPRLYARGRRTWIFAEPRRGAARLGYLRAGASSPTTPSPAGREGCAGGWYSVEPRGFVCVGARATLDANDPIVVATRDTPPDFGRRLPYLYGTVRRPGPVYHALPSSDDLGRAEAGLDERMDAWLTAGGERGASYAQHVWLGRPGVAPDPAVLWRERRTEGVPPFLSEGAPLPLFGPRDDAEDETAIGERMRHRAGYSFLRTLVWQGRRYGLTPNLELAPVDRFRPIQGSSFRGVEPGKDITFPFAFVRSPRARRYRLDNQRLVDAGPAEYRAAIKLTGKQSFFRKRLHYETSEGEWLSDAHASRLDSVKRLPGFGKNGEKWLDVNLTKQTLVAYEGDKAVYATLISSGEAGLEDPEHTTATKRGIFRIHTKHVTSTMSSDEAGEEFELRDVPYVQYFDQGYALHGAYWHDRFGTPKSHGCLNLSPEDARRLFFFTEPALPENWHGVLRPLTGTVVWVHQ